MQINGLTVLISGNYNAFNEGFNGAGVYMCSGNYQSNTFNQPIYIGSSINLQQRIDGRHIPSLNSNNHYNNLLQASWNKHSSENFIWILLETCLSTETLIREQFYLDLYKPFIDEKNGFNIAHIASMPPGMQGREFTKQHKDKLSLSHKGKKMLEKTRKALFKSNIGRIPSKESKMKIAHTRKERGIKPSKKAISKLIESNSKEYIITDPFGVIFNIKNLSKFCRENNLEVKNMSALACGKGKFHRGWKCSLARI